MKKGAKSTLFLTDRYMVTTKSCQSIGYPLIVAPLNTEANVPEITLAGSCS